MSRKEQKRRRRGKRKRGKRRLQKIKKPGHVSRDLGNRVIQNQRVISSKR